jgi:rsbT co-antagonist protein RsbR
METPRKELVEKTLFEIKSLSCPFIKLTKTTGLVPLFGNLDVELIGQNAKRILEKSQKGCYQEVLFDFTGVGDLIIEGVEAFVALVIGTSINGAAAVYYWN